MEKTQKIPLRLFYRTIDDLIINHQSDAAINRSLYLLQIFNKNLSVYQLLGKGLLDKQDFENSKIVFDKILNIDPDDFVSHIGYSIVWEKAGNLGKSLESVLRAYELQPSNESLKNEVKRLQEASTGTAPDQIRLTRGTLIKMYSNSQLAEQAIAESRLGIHENPDRIDFKIHLAKMLSFSNNCIEAIETCMDIIRILPYCKPALLILYNCISSTANSDAADIYKSRLTEIDPYYQFIKPDTHSVNDIPDIAVMVEEKNEPLKPIENIGDFINNIWNKEPLDGFGTDNDASIENWSSIIDQAISTNIAGSPLSESSYTEVKSPFEDDSTSDEDFQSGEELNESSIETENPSKENNMLDSEKNGFSNLEITENKEFPITIDELPDQDELDEMGPSLEDDIHAWIPEDKESVENIDHETPIDINDATVQPQKVTTFDWEEAIANHETTHHQTPSIQLEDTQKIRILSDDPESLLLQAFDSIESNNIMFAKKCFTKLIDSNYKLQTIADSLENICEQKPKNLDLWLILVDIYKKLGKKEKTLSTLVKAQNNLSLE